MIKLRSSLIVTVLLAATLIVALGAEVAVAARFQDRGAPVSAKTPVRRSVGPCTGEPDNGNNGAPIKSTTPSFLSPTGTSWLTDLVSQWAMKRHFRHSSGTR